jgi:hypothetical protein
VRTAAEGGPTVGRQRPANDLIVQPDAVAVIVCDKEGKYKVTTNELQDALHGEAVPA